LRDALRTEERNGTAMRVLKEVRAQLRSYHLKSGLFHFHRGEMGPAAEFFARALEEDADLTAADRRTAERYLVEAHVFAADEQMAAGEYEAAADAYRAALAAIPDYPDIHLKLGAALEKLDLGDEAVEEYRRAAFISPDFDGAHLKLGFAQLARGDADGARAAFRAALEARERAARARLEDAEQALAEGRLDDARGIYVETFREGIESFRRRFAAGMKALRAERWEDAAEEFGAAAEAFPLYADVHNYLGVALAEGGRIDEAAEEFQRCARLNPDCLAAWLNLSCVAKARGDERRAERALREVLRREPDNTAALQLLEQLRGDNRPPARRDRAEQGNAL